jgi:3-dehydroquinate synthase
MTKVVRVEVDPAYDVHIGAGVFELARRRARASDALVRDGGLPAHLGFLGSRIGIALPAGEAAKDWHGLELVVSTLAERACDRATTLFAVGGGATLDVAGLAAALYMRGIDVVYCPTTLLAMVDASVGGKTAINLEAGKNLVGVVRQPRAVYADLELLASLGDDEYRSGLGEVLKSALIGGEGFLARLEEAAPQLVERDPATLEDVVARCVRLKARIVARDPFERGARRALNLGHTFAHAVEHVAGFGRVPHGVAVAVGVGLALELAKTTRKLRDPRLPARVRKLAERLGLPATLEELRAAHRTRLPAEKLLAAMAHDKKALAATPRFVLPLRAGRLELGAECEPEAVRAVLEARPAARVTRARTAKSKRARRT